MATLNCYFLIAIQARQYCARGLKDLKTAGIGLYRAASWTVGCLLAGGLGGVGLAGLARQARCFTFASPKESKQRKGDPQSGSLRCPGKAGAAQAQPGPVDPGSGAGAIHLCHCERSAAIHDCAFSTMDRRTSFAMTNRGRDRMGIRRAERAEGVLRIRLLAAGIGLLPDPTPSGCAEERSFRRIRAARCLSRRRVCADPA